MERIWRNRASNRIGKRASNTGKCSVSSIDSKLMARDWLDHLPYSCEQPKNKGHKRRKQSTNLNSNKHRRVHRMLTVRQAISDQFRGPFFTINASDLFQFCPRENLPLIASSVVYDFHIYKLRAAPLNRTRTRTQMRARVGIRTEVAIRVGSVANEMV